MKISTKGRYALRMMLDLALQETNEYVSIKSIARRQDISEKYLEQIVTLLGRAGFVNSARGATGGYKLSKPSCEYTVGMILRSVEGDFSPVSCLLNDGADCPRREFCVTIEVWQQMKDAMDNVIDNITLENLVEKSKAKKSYEYTI